MKADGNPIDDIADKVGMNRKSVMLCINKYSESAGHFQLSTVSQSKDRTILEAADIKPNKIKSDDKHPTFIRDYEFKRLDKVSLLAGLDLQTGESIPLVCDKHSTKEYIEFLKLLDAKYPKGDKIRLILDNLKEHTSEEARKYLANVPERFEFVFAPKHGFWLNLDEGFFSKMTRQMIKGIRVKAKDELTQRIYQYCTGINSEPVVYHWKYKLEEIASDAEVKVEIFPNEKSS